MHSKPQLLAWLTCDGVHIDPATGKHTVLGVFSNIHSDQFPLIHPLMFWFLNGSSLCLLGWGLLPEAQRAQFGWIQ